MFIKWSFDDILNIIWWSYDDHMIDRGGGILKYYGPVCHHHHHHVVIKDRCVNRHHHRLVVIKDWCANHHYHPNNNYQYPVIKNWYVNHHHHVVIKERCVNHHHPHHHLLVIVMIMWKSSNDHNWFGIDQQTNKQTNYHKMTI